MNRGAIREVAEDGNGELYRKITLVIEGFPAANKYCELTLRDRSRLSDSPNCGMKFLDKAYQRLLAAEKEYYTTAAAAHDVTSYGTVIAPIMKMMKEVSYQTL